MNEDGSLYKKIRIREIKEEVKDFKVFVFEDEHNIKYQSGQYLTLISYHNQTEVRRSYSITSSPALSEALSIGVKRVANGFFSRQLIDHTKEGDDILTIGSGGLFILPDDIQNYKQLFFFAAGSGITPIYSLIKTALHIFEHVSIVLVYSNASEEKTAFLKELKQLQQRFQHRFRVEWLFSNSADLSRARLHRDLIVELISTLKKENNSTLFYICGPESYMRLCTYTLQEKGIGPGNIKKENFVIHTIPKANAFPPDKKERVVEIRRGSTTYHVIVTYPDSILKAAKKQGILLPYSCEAGRCGNCVAKCTKGMVWHSYNEVLTERELKKGLVLTCVGHPVGGNLQLEI